MSTRQELDALSKSHASGADGYIDGIKLFATKYLEDTAIMPNEYADLNRKQTVLHFGGYLSAHKQISAEYTYGFADGVATYADRISLDADTSVIKAQLSSLQDEFESESATATAKALTLGDTQESLAKSIVRKVGALAIALEVTSTPKTVDAIMVAIKELEALLPQSEVVAQEIKGKVLV
jgi:hypothetical protein